MKLIVLPLIAAVAVSACDVKNPTGPQFGAVAGTIASTTGTPLVNVLFTLGDVFFSSDSTRSGADGSWRFDHVPVGTGSISVDNTSLPVGCASVPTFNYNVLQGGKTTRITLTVPC